MKFQYEAASYPWTERLASGFCPDCGTPAIASRSYTPDFFLENGVIIESKGIFTVKDRKIALAMKEQEIEVKLLFQYDNKLSRKSSTRYSTWCEKNKLDYAIKIIPEEWLQ